MHGLMKRDSIRSLILSSSIVFNIEKSRVDVYNFHKEWGGKEIRCTSLFSYFTNPTKVSNKFSVSVKFPLSEAGQGNCSVAEFPHPPFAFAKTFSETGWEGANEK